MGVVQSCSIPGFFFIGNRQLGNSVRFLAGNRQPQKKNSQPGGPILGPMNLGNFQIGQIRQPVRPMQNYWDKITTNLPKMAQLSQIWDL